MVLVLQVSVRGLAKQSPFDIVVDETASETEKYAASMLENVLETVLCTEAEFPVVASSSRSSVSIVSTSKEDLGEEGFELRLESENKYVISGSTSSISRRGTIYGVVEFLERVGVRFLTSSVTVSKSDCPWNNSSATFTGLPSEYTFVPLFEERNVGAFDVDHSAPEFAIHQRLNLGPKISQSMGGGPTYATPPGYVHTSYALVDKDQFFETHNEWFWPRDDKTVYGQLCWTNTSLIEYVISQVKTMLRNQPNATVISVSQNDNGNYCNDTNEWAVIQEEGSPSGPLLRAVNRVAEAIEEEFPHVRTTHTPFVIIATHINTHRTQVAVDTLAYQYTRKPPKITKPRDNVIVRLCSIECNFAVPFSDESNKAFRDDMVGWSNISERIWIWNYVTDFGNYVMPWPDYQAIPKNIRWFANHSVRGLYQEANYQSYGGDCAELKTYLMSKLMWDQSLNETDIVTEFLELYFSKSIAPHIQAYLDLWIEQVEMSNFYLGESVPYVVSGNHSRITNAQIYVLSNTGTLHHISIPKPCLRVHDC